MYIDQLWLKFYNNIGNFCVELCVLSQRWYYFKICESEESEKENYNDDRRITSTSRKHGDDVNSLVDESEDFLVELEDEGDSFGKDFEN